jgi:hypothetical protein
MNTPPTRGYLLMEAMIAGSLLTIAIVSTLSMIGTAKADAIYANNRGVAAALARAKADQLATSSVATGCAPGNQATYVTVSTNYPAFEHKWTVASATAIKAASSPAITAAMCDVDVSVRYPARIGSRQDTEDGTTDGQGLVRYRRLYTP